MYMSVYTYIKVYIHIYKYIYTRRGGVDAAREGFWRGADREVPFDAVGRIWGQV